MARHWLTNQVSSIFRFYKVFFSIILLLSHRVAQGKQEEKIVYFIHADYIQIPAYKYKIGDNQSFIAKFVVVYVLCTCAGACAYGTYPYNIFHWNIYCTMCTITYTHIQSHNKCSQRPRCCYHFIGVIAVSFYQITENDRTWWKSGFIQCTFGVVESVVYFWLPLAKDSLISVA